MALLRPLYPAPKHTKLIRGASTTRKDTPGKSKSNYRSPVADAALRCDGCNVAQKSMHREGRACDLRIPGKDPGHIRNAVPALRAGGTGYPPNSSFVHMDVGRLRQWRD